MSSSTSKRKTRSVKNWMSLPYTVLNHTENISSMNWKAPQKRSSKGPIELTWTRSLNAAPRRLRNWKSGF